MTTQPSAPNATGLPTADLEDYLSKIKKEQGDLESFEQALKTKVAHLTWKGHNADTFTDDVKKDLRQLADLKDDLTRLQSLLKDLDTKVAGQKKLIANAQQAVIAHLDGKPLPTKVATELGLQPGYLPPNGSYEWVTAAKDLDLKVKA